MLPFFATSRVSGLASIVQFNGIVTAIKFNKIFAGAEPPLWNLWGEGLEPLSSSILYAYVCSNKVDEVVKTFYFSKK